MEVFAYIIFYFILFIFFFFACANFFALQALLPLRRCLFFLNDFFGSHAPRVFPSSLSLPSEGWDGGGQSRDALVLLPEGFPLLPLDLVQRGGGGGGGSGRVFGAREFASVSSVHSWTGDPGVALLPWTPATCSVPVGSPSSSLHARRGDGAGESSGVFSVLGCLSRLISARSARW